MKNSNTYIVKAKNFLQKALDDQDLKLFYQPQLKIETGKLTGMEALLRWQHPRLGEISPSQFIPLAEKANLMGLINQWVLKTACFQNKIWQNMGLPHLTISVNLSHQQLADPNFVDQVHQILEETKLDPQWLELEITEKVILRDVHCTYRVSQQLKQLGVRLSIDDFGIGYSSLSQLLQFSFNTLKIAQNCVKNISNNQENIDLITSILALKNTINLRVVAEGVETQEQLDLLRNLRCEEMQGFLFSQPLPQDKATNFLSLYNQKKEPKHYLSSIFDCLREKSLDKDMNLVKQQVFSYPYS